MTEKTGVKVKVRCKNCDAVLDGEQETYYMTFKRYYQVRCYQCNSLDTAETNEPYRPPKWERRPPALGVQARESVGTKDKVR